jgi:hypothetical protein
VAHAARAGAGEERWSMPRAPSDGSSIGRSTGGDAKDEEARQRHQDEIDREMECSDDMVRRSMGKDAQPTEERRARL